MPDLHPDIIRAIQRVSRTPRGRKFDRFAERKYGIHGWKLAAKQLQGEGGGTTANPRTSSAGARGPAQFIPPTAAAMRQRYGLNPYGSDRQAVASLMQYDMDRHGVAGYNPGMPSYTSYVLHQKLGSKTKRQLRGAPGSVLDPRAKQDTGDGSFSLQGPSSTSVGLQSSTIPGQSFEPERDSARQGLLLGGPLTLNRLLQYKTEMNSLQDIPAQQVFGDLSVKRTQGPKIKVKTNAQPQPGHAVSEAAATGARGGQRGRVIVSPGANRAGVGLAPVTMRLISRLAGNLGRPVTIGTGTAHDRMTVNGNVSDHWDGHAADIPSSGRQLIHYGQVALMTFGMSRKQALRQRGGLYNLQYRGHRVQVIFNTQQGGDHTDHLHVGVR